MRGLHLTADLYRCRCEASWLADAQRLGQWSRQAAESAGLTVERELSYACAAGGATTTTLLLPGSHVLLHTWPQERAALVDVCLSDPHGELAAKARGLMQALVQHLQPEWTEQRSLDRGDGE